MWLAAAMQFDTMVGIGGADDVGHGFSLIGGDVRAEIQGDEFTVSGLHGFQQPHHRLRYIIPGHFQRAIMQADDLAVLYRHSIEFHGAGGGGHFTTLNFADGLFHRGFDRLQVAVGIVLKQRGDALGDGTARHDDHLFLSG